MADLHIEDSTEGEGWETERDRERGRREGCVKDLKMILKNQ